MGAQHPRQQPIAFNPSTAGFTQIHSETGNLTWLNGTTGEELEEFQFVSSNER